MAIVPLMLLATASAAALDMSSSGQDNHVVAHADAAVLAPISEEMFLHGYHLFVFRL